MSRLMQYNSWMFISKDGVVTYLTLSRHAKASITEPEVTEVSAKIKSRV